MRRSFLSVVVLTVLAASMMALPAAAAPENGWAAAGLWLQEGQQQQGWFASEFHLTDFASLSLEYQSNEVMVAGWFNKTQRWGFYGGAGFSDYSPRWEVGVWGNTELSPTIQVAGWLGVTAQTNAPTTEAKFTARAEAYIPVSEQFFVLVGVDDYFVKDQHNFAARVGVGLDF